jgi:hypothetical protein
MVESRRQDSPIALSGHCNEFPRHLTIVAPTCTSVFRCARQKISSKRQMVANRRLTNSPDRPEHFGDAARLVLRARR